MKRCPGCGEEKPFGEFPRNRNTNDGLASNCKLCREQKSRASRIRNVGTTSAYHRKHRDGITAAEVASLLGQGGACPICRTRPPSHVDHDHATGEVRGILCFGCNGGLGLFRDNPIWLPRAVIYLLSRDDLKRKAS